MGLMSRKNLIKFFMIEWFISLINLLFSSHLDSLRNHIRGPSSLDWIKSHIFLMDGVAGTSGFIMRNSLSCMEIGTFSFIPSSLPSSTSTVPVLENVRLATLFSFSVWRSQEGAGGFISTFALTLEPSSCLFFFQEARRVCAVFFSSLQCLIL